MKDVASPRGRRLVDAALKQGHQVGRPLPGMDGAGLAEDVHASAHPAQRLHDLDGIRLLIELKARERERDHEGEFEIERERRRDSVIQRVTRGWSQGVEQEFPAIRREHDRSPARRPYH